MEFTLIEKPTEIDECWESLDRPSDLVTALDDDVKECDQPPQESPASLKMKPAASSPSASRSKSFLAFGASCLVSLFLSGSTSTSTSPESSPAKSKTTTGTTAYNFSTWKPYQQEEFPSPLSLFDNTPVLSMNNATTTTTNTLLHQSINTMDINLQSLMEGDRSATINNPYEAFSKALVMMPYTNFECTAGQTTTTTPSSKQQYYNQTTCLSSAAMMMTTTSTTKTLMTLYSPNPLVPYVSAYSV